MNNMKAINKILRKLNRIIFIIYVFIPISLFLEYKLWNLFIKSADGYHPLREKIIQFPSYFIYKYLISAYPYDNKPLFPAIFLFQLILLIAEIITGIILKKKTWVSVLLFVADMIIFGAVVSVLAIQAGMSI